MVDYNTLQKKRNMIVGGFVVIAFCALLWMVFIFGELPVIVSGLRSFNVLVKFPDALGVQTGTPIYYCGYQIGKVINVMGPERIENDNTKQVYHQVKVTLAIEKKYTNIPSNIEVKIMKRSMGSSYIELEVDPATPLELLDPANPKSMFLCEGMILQGSTGVGSELIPEEMQKRINETLDSIKSSTESFNEIVGDDVNQANIKRILAEAAVATEKLNKALGEFNRLMDKINNGDGTVAKLLNDAQLYEDLHDTFEELRLTLEQLKIFTSDVNKEGGIKLKLKLF
jgi:phospholipid/cholesterol/gamma-HCH transport system substrate-binding protein